MPRGIPNNPKKSDNKLTSTAKYFATKKANQLLKISEMSGEITELKNQLSLACKGRDLAIDQRQSFEQIVNEVNDSYGQYYVTIEVRRRDQVPVVMASTFNVNTANEEFAFNLNKHDIKVEFNKVEK